MPSAFGVPINSCSRFNLHDRHYNLSQFKGKAKALTRTYAFLATILSYGNAEWEALSIFLNLLIPKHAPPRHA